MSKTFAQQVKAIRNRKEWSQDRLVVELEKLDEPMDRATVARIEAGKRGVSVDDLFVFALALGVPPVYLLLPRAAEQVELASGYTVGGWEALAWLRGLYPVNLTDDVDTQAALASAGVRFFYESCPDFEADSIRRFPLARDLWLASWLAMSYAGLGDAPHRERLARILEYIADTAQVGLTHLDTVKEMS